MAQLTREAAVKAARIMRERGWRVFPLPVGQKKPDREKGWQKVEETVTNDNLDELWKNGENLGIILDPPLVDIDLDCDEAVRIAPRFLPPTPFKFGRGGVLTHYVYEAENASSATFIDSVAREKKRDGDDTAKEMLVEVRHDNGYTMFPPSVHPSGEQLKFAPKEGWPETVLFDDLYRRVEVIAAVALMVRYWPGPGARNEATLALAGGLVRAEREKLIEARAVDAVMQAIVEEGGNSDPVSDFKTIERTRQTFAKIDGGNDKKKVKGWLSLEKIIGSNGKVVVKQFREWLKIYPKTKKTAQASQLLNAAFAQQIIWEVDGQGNKVPARIAKNASIILQNDPHFFEHDGEGGGGGDDGQDGDGVTPEPLIYFDEFRRCKMVSRPLPWDDTRNWHEEYPRQWYDVDIIDMQGYLTQQWGFMIGKEAVADGVESLAALHYQHEVRDYLKNLVWDHTPRLESMGPRYFSTESSDYESLVFKMWMIGAVARVMDPGCQMDTVIILEGDQGLGKSSALRTLVGKRDWFTDDVVDMHTKAGAETITGAWIVELGELSSMKRADIDTVKEFVVRRVDKYRPPYGRETIQVPRMSVFAGTVNPGEDGYLKDPTGNRRFWPVACGQVIDLSGIERDRDQLWAEAYSCYERGEPWYLTKVDVELLKEFERKQMARRERSGMEGTIVGYLQQLVEESDETEFKITVAQIAIEAIGYSVKEASEGFRVKQIGEVLRKLMFKHQGRGTFKYQPEPDRKPIPLHSSVYLITASQLHEITDSDIEMRSVSRRSRNNETEDGLAGAGSAFDGDDDIPF